MDFGIVVYKDSTENYIVLAEGNIEELNSIFNIIVENSNNKSSIYIVKVEKEEYEKNKKVLVLLNQFIEQSIMNNQQ